MSRLPTAGIRLKVEGAKRFQADTKQSSKAMTLLQGRFSKVSKAFKNGKGFQEINRQMGQFTKILGGKLGGVLGNLSKMGGVFGKLGGQMGGVLSQFKGFASVLAAIPPPALAAIAAIAGLIALAPAAISKYGNLQAKLNEVFTLLPDLSHTAMQGIESDLQQLNLQFGLTSDQSVPALYQAISAGVPRDNVFDFLEVAQRAARGGVTDLTTAIDGITSVVNAYGSDVLGAAEASDLMFTAVRLGKTTIGELSSSLFNVIPTAAALNVSFDNVTAAVAALTAQGVPTSIATTQIRAALVSLQKPSSKLFQFFQQLTGQSFEEFIAAGGTLPEAFNLIRNATDESGISLVSLTGRVEATNAILGLTGPNAQRFTTALNEMGASAGATDTAFRQMNQGIQPAFAQLNAGFNTILEQIGSLIEPIITPIVLLVASVVRHFSAWFSVLQAVFGIFKPIIDVFQFFIGLIIHAIDALSGIVRKIAQFINFMNGIRDAILNKLLAPARKAFEIVKQLFGQVITILELLGTRMLLGGARALGAFANGLLKAANEQVFPVVIAIATAIADFLVGNSPPPKGPLSKIDKGGENTMLAWLEGFAGTSLDPISKVSAEVDGLMGNIGSLSLPQVSARLAGLDRAIAPFQNRVKLLEANLNSIKQFTDAALQGTDKLIEQTIKRLADGEEGSAAALRQLRAQRAEIGKVIESREADVARSKLQLGLAKAQQAQERAALEIRKAQFGVASKITQQAKDAAQSSKKAAAPKKAAVGGASGSGFAIADTEGLGTGLENATLPEDGNSFLDQLGAEFSAQIDPAQLALLQENQSALGEQIGRFGEANIVDRITDSFSGLTEGLQDFFAAPFEEKVDTVIALLIGGEAGGGGLVGNLTGFVTGGISGAFGLLPDELQNNLTGHFNDAVDTVSGFFSTGSGTSIRNALSNFSSTGVGEVFGDLGTNLVTWLQDPFGTATNAVLGLFGLGDAAASDNGATSLSSMLSNFVITDLPAIFLGLPTALTTALTSPFRTAINGVLQFFGLGGGQSVEGGAAQVSSLDSNLRSFVTTLIPNIFANLGTQLQTSFVSVISTAVGNVISLFVDSENSDSIFSRLNTFFTGSNEDEGSFAWLLQNGVSAVTRLVPLMRSALYNLAGTFWEAFAVPILEIFNWVIGKINQFADRVEGATSGLTNVINTLTGSDAGFDVPTLERFDTSRPAWLSPPSAKIGGAFMGPGLLNVHQGEQLVDLGNSQKIGVFPAAITQMMQSLTSMVSGFMTGGATPAFASGYGNTNISNSTDRSVTASFSGSDMNQQEMLRQIRIMMGVS